jgi:hypothetical protein
MMSAQKGRIELLGNKMPFHTQRCFWRLILSYSSDIPPVLTIKDQFCRVIAMTNSTQVLNDILQ